VTASKQAAINNFGRWKCLLRVGSLLAAVTCPLTAQARLQLILAMNAYHFPACLQAQAACIGRIFSTFKILATGTLSKRCQH